MQEKLNSEKNLKKEQIYRTHISLFQNLQQIYSIPDSGLPA